MKIRLILLVLFSAVISGYAQNQNFNDTQIMNGFEKKITGEDFSYHSSIPQAKECLLIRATDGNSSLEWETSPAPENPQHNFVTFVWLAGVGSSPGRARFDMQVNGQDKFSFWADGANSFEVKANDGSILSFQKDMTDQHGDKFGFMYLKIPTGNVEKGKPLRIKVTGGKFEKTSWYMTFKFPFQNQVTLKSLPAISVKNGQNSQLGVMGIFHFDKPEKAKIYIENELLKETDLVFGYNYIRVELPEVAVQKILNYRLETGSRTEKGTLTVNPVKKWRVNFVQHSHTDIGYTRPQTEILAEQFQVIGLV